MKRTFWFGTLGALAVLPLTLNLMLDSWFSRALVSEFLIPIDDARFYHALNSVFPGGYGQAALSVRVLCWGAALFLLVKLRFLTRERLNPAKALAEYRQRHKGGLPGFVIKLVVAGAFMAVSLGSGLDMFFYYPPETIEHMHSSFGGASGAVAVYLFPMVQTTSYGFLASAMLYALVTSVSLVEFAKKAAVGGLVMACGIAMLSAAGSYLDVERYLGDIPGVTNEPEHRALVVLTGKPVVLPIITLYNDCPVHGSFCRQIQSTAHNAEAVEAYLESRDFNTVLRGTGLNFIAQYRLSTLDTAGALRAYKKALDVTGDKTQGMSVMARLVYAPATRPYKEVLDDLSGSGVYQIAGRTALRLGRAYARYGELETSRVWNEIGMITSNNLDEDAIMFFSVPAAPPFNSGSISGMVTLDGVPAGGIMVGVMTTRACGAMLKTQAGMKTAVVPFYDLQGVTDGTATGADGSFRFTGLGADEYVLLLSLPLMDGEDIGIKPGTGIAAISVDVPAVDVGVIRVVSAAN